VLEAVTVYRNEVGQHVLLRGQRRTVTAAELGTPAEARAAGEEAVPGARRPAERGGSRGLARLTAVLSVGTGRRRPSPRFR